MPSEIAASSSRIQLRSLDMKDFGEKARFLQNHDGNFGKWWYCHLYRNIRGHVWGEMTSLLSVGIFINSANDRGMAYLLHCSIFGSLTGSARSQDSANGACNLLLYDRHHALFPTPIRCDAHSQLQQLRCIMLLEKIHQGIHECLATVDPTASTMNA